MQRIQERLARLPSEMRVARADEYEAKKALGMANNALMLVRGAVLDTSPPEGKSIAERDAAAVLILEADPQWRRSQEIVARAEDDLVAGKLYVRALEDELSCLRSQVRLITAMMVLMATGTPLEDVPVADLMLDRELGTP